MENKRLKVVHLIATNEGGAYRAAKRINWALNNIGVDSKILILFKRKEEPNINSFYKSNMQIFFHKIIYMASVSKLKKYNIIGNIYESKIGVNILKNKLMKSADIINIHWVNDGMLSYNGIKRLGEKTGKRIVWTLHDMYAFTAGCYYSNGCDEYKRGCTHCHYIENNNQAQTYITSLFRKKKDALKENVSFVGCSNWISGCANESIISKNCLVETIPNPIDLKIFYPRRDFSRVYQRYMIPMGKKIILFGAMSAFSDKRKGYGYLLKALEFVENKKEYHIIVFGGKNDFLLPVNMEYTNIGVINNDDDLAMIYSAADVFIAPSIQENLSNTVMESLACGTPVVAFNIGGMPDLIEHQKNGYLARLYDSEDLAEGIQFCSKNKKDLSCICLKLVNERFNYKIIGEKYLKHYKKKVKKINEEGVK